MTNCAARGHILHSKDMPRTVTQGLFLGFRPQEGNAFAAVPVIPSDRLLGAPFHLLRPKSAGSPPVLPLLVLPGFWGGRMRDSSKVAFFFPSRRHKQFDARRKEPCSLSATGRVPREPCPRHRHSRKRKHGRPVGSRREVCYL